jgi:MFS family permease
MNIFLREIRTFLIIWFGQLISTLGSTLTGFGLGVWIYERTGSTTLFALNMLAVFVPAVALAPFAGVLVDRYDRRLVMIISDTGAALSTLVIALILSLGDLQVWHIYALTALSSAFNTVQFPAFSAASTLIVPDKHRGRAGGMQQTGWAISGLLGPGIAGLLYVTVGLKGIIWIDVLTFCFAVTTMLFVFLPRPERSKESEAEGGSFLQEALFGWKYLYRRPGLFGLLWFFAFLNFCGSLTLPLITPMLLDQTTPDIVGLIGSIGGVGMMVGTIIMSAWGGFKRRALTIIPMEFIAGIGILLAGVSPAIPLIAAGNFLFLFTLPISNGASQAMWQTKVAPDVQGRVFSTRLMIANILIPIAYILAGPLSESVFIPAMTVGGRLDGTPIGALLGVGPGRGIGLMLVLGGMLYSLAAVVALNYRPLRRLDLDLPDAAPATVTAKSL